jgi:hypothetical protein
VANTPPRAPPAPSTPSLSDLQHLNLPQTPTRAEQQTQSLAAATTTPESLFNTIAEAFTHDTDEAAANAIHELCALPLQAAGPESLTSLVQWRSASLERSDIFDDADHHCQHFTFRATRATEAGSAASVSSAPPEAQLTIQFSLLNYGVAAPRWRIVSIDVIDPADAHAEPDLTDEHLDLEDLEDLEDPDDEDLDLDDFDLDTTTLAALATTPLTTHQRPP